MRRPSRRELFTGKSGSKGEVPDEPVQEPRNNLTVSRRTFLQLAGALAVGVEGARFEHLQQEKTPPGTPHKSQADTADLHRMEKTSPGAYAETLGTQALLTLGAVLLSKFLEERGISAGNASADKIQKALTEYPLDQYIKGVAVAPLVEETLYRMIPSLFVGNRAAGHHYEVGIPAAIVFAYAHNITKDEEGMRFDTKTIPLPQFLLGVFYWYLVREKGLSHAMLAHALHNSAALTMAKVLAEKFPKEPPQE